MRANTTITMLIAGLVVLASLGPAAAARPAADANTDLLASYSAQNEHANVTVQESVHVRMHVDADGWTIHAAHAGEGTATVTIEALEGSYEGEGTYEIDGEETIDLPAPDEPVTLRITVETDHLTETQVIEFVEVSIKCADTELSMLRPILVRAEATVDGEQVYVHEHADARIQPELPEEVCNVEHPDQPVIGDLPAVNWSADDIRGAYNWSHEQAQNGYEEGQNDSDDWYNRTHDGAMDAYEESHDEAMNSYEDGHDEATRAYEESRDAAREAYGDAWQRYHETYDFGQQVASDARDDAEMVREDAEDDAETVREDAETDAETVREDAESDGERIANDARDDAEMVREDATDTAEQVGSDVEELSDDAEDVNASASSETRVDVDANAEASASYGDGSASADADATVDLNVHSRNTADSSHTPGLTTDVSAVSQLKAQFGGRVSA